MLISGFCIKRIEPHDAYGQINNFILYFLSERDKVWKAIYFSIDYDRAKEEYRYQMTRRQSRLEVTHMNYQNHTDAVDLPKHRALLTRPA